LIGGIHIQQYLFYRNLFRKKKQPLVRKCFITKGKRQQELDRQCCSNAFAPPHPKFETVRPDNLIQSSNQIVFNDTRRYCLTSDETYKNNSVYWFTVTTWDDGSQFSMK